MSTATSGRRMDPIKSKVELAQSLGLGGWWVFAAAMWSALDRSTNP
jgi:hypothetical protein